MRFSFLFKAHRALAQNPKNPKKGQSSLEYILVLAMIVGVVLGFQKLAGPAIETYMQAQVAQVQTKGSGGGFKDQRNYYNQTCAVSDGGTSVSCVNP